MQPLDFSILPKNSAVTKSSSLISRHSILALPGIWLNRITHRWSIRQKIGYGYVLAISIAILGTAMGLIVGEHYDDRARETVRDAQKIYELMDHLEKAVLKVKVHQQRAITTAQNTARLREEITQLRDSLITGRQLLSSLKFNLKNYRGLPGDDTVRLKTSLRTYNTELESYNQLVETLLQNLDTNNLTSSQIEVIKQILEMTLKEQQVPKVEELSKSLEELVASTAKQRQQAETIFKAAKVLRVLIIVASMLLSIAIAVALALYTSRAIARPIKAVTQVAKQAAQERNYDLQALVTTEDEIGVLAASLNQLIQRVATQIRDLQHAQAQLIQNEKMTSLGQMVAGIAHEINNPVNFIYGNLNHAHHYTQDLLELVQLYQQYYPQPIPEIQAKIEEIELNFLSEDFPKLISSLQIGAERIQQTVLSLRNFSRLDESETKKVDIHEGIENTLVVLNHRIKQGIEVIKHYQSLPLIDCYPAQLNQVFMNILSNALDELLDNKFPQPQIVIQTKLINFNQFEIRIRDNGSGIAPEIKDKIFDPFFTTKPIGKGTGMGLAICYQIVEKHHGKIELASQLGQGAEFIVTLPVEQDSAK
ncbi:MAG: HAMP domain-containing protein [Coleofasciculus sp. S288]|nr:HAMP domain-containing protein [Coleofasciculus sp. S288]